MFAEKALLIFLFYHFSLNTLLAATIGDEDDIDIDSVKVMFFYGPTYDDHQEYDLNDAVSLLKHPKFIHDRTTCFLPPYRHWKHNPATILMAKAYLKQNTTNFLNINWENLANGDYISAQLSVLKFAPKVADFIIELFENGLNEDSFSMTGQSMGARGIAVIARDVIERSNGRRIISRITPLDPSNEEAHDVFILPEIKKSYAKFVDIIHTDAGGIGTKKSMGHANFWPNNGVGLQPGCPKNDKRICSHSKAHVYWVESINNELGSNFLAYPSGSYKELMQYGADNYKHAAVPMGIDCPSSARGDYYLQHSTTFGECFTHMPYVKGIYCK